MSTEYLAGALSTGPKIFCDDLQYFRRYIREIPQVLLLIRIGRARTTRDQMYHVRPRERLLRSRKRDESICWFELVNDRLMAASRRGDSLSVKD